MNYVTNEKVNGTSYKEIAAKYSPSDIYYLITKVIKGGSGVWGKSLISTHSQLSVDEFTKAVDYILSLKEEKNEDKNLLPIEGELTFEEYIKSNSKGNYVLSASYIDKGNKETEDSAIPISEYIVFKK
jgi:cytochrome c